jgi:hypothetical protein
VIQRFPFHSRAVIREEHHLRKDKSMKIIEAMRKRDNLLDKAEDLRQKISKHAAYLSVETPVYGTKEDQSKKIQEWLDSHRDCLREVMRLRLAITRTNAITPVTIELGGKQIKRTIQEWIFRRQTMAALERNAWASLNDGGRKEGQMRQSNDEIIDVKIIRCYQPAQRDEFTEIFRSEPAEIDGTLEVINATTDIVEEGEDFIARVSALAK